MTQPNENRYKTPMAAFKERAERFCAALAGRVHSDSAALVRSDRDR